MNKIEESVERARKRQQFSEDYPSISRMENAGPGHRVLVIYRTENRLQDLLEAEDRLKNLTDD